MTWLNMISDQRVGLAGRVVSGAPKDTLHFVDLVFNPDSGRRPEVLITDRRASVGVRTAAHQRPRSLLVPAS